MENRWSDLSAVAAAMRYPESAHLHARQALLDAGIVPNGTATQQLQFNNALLGMSGLGVDWPHNPRIRTQPYEATDDELWDIDTAIVTSDFRQGARRAIGYGTSGRFIPPEATYTNIAGRKAILVGYGGAGIATAYALGRYGVKDITVIEKNGAEGIGGIWHPGNTGIAGGLRNNPSPIVVEDGANKITLRPAEHLPLAISNEYNSAEAITRFLNEIYLATNPRPKIIQGTVGRIVPKSYDHSVFYVDADGRERLVKAPVVVYAGGVADPLPLNGKMQTSTPDSEGGLRWQPQIRPEIAPGNWVINGAAGNTCIATIRQLQAYRAAGLDVNYRLLTHHSEKAMRNPYDAIDGPVPLARTLGNLGGIELDLQRSYEAYFHALDAGEIVTDVYRWDLDRLNSEVIVHSKTQGILRLPCDPNHLCNFLGSGHRRETLEAMGMTVDAGRVRYVWTGEVQNDSGRAGRNGLHLGLLANGPVLRSDANLNAPVLGGILRRAELIAFAAAQRMREVVDLENGVLRIEPENTRTSIPVHGILKRAGVGLETPQKGGQDCHPQERTQTNGGGLTAEDIEKLNATRAVLPPHGEPQEDTTEKTPRKERLGGLFRHLLSREPDSPQTTVPDSQVSKRDNTER